MCVQRTSQNIRYQASSTFSSIRSRGCPLTLWMMVPQKCAIVPSCKKAEAVAGDRSSLATTPASHCQPPHEQHIVSNEPPLFPCFIIKLDALTTSTSICFSVPFLPKGLCATIFLHWVANSRLQHARPLATSPDNLQRCPMHTKRPLLKLGAAQEAAMVTPASEAHSAIGSLSPSL
jgi:hypothetical protein